MKQLTGDQRFVEEALVKLFGAGAKVVQDLDRQLRIALEIMSLIDSAHPSGAEYCVKSVALCEHTPDEAGCKRGL
jgi:hypothetical protein